MGTQGGDRGTPLGACARILRGVAQRVGNVAAQWHRSRCVLPVGVRGQP